VVGDVTDDEVLAAAGIARARALIAALNTDADNVYVTLSARAVRPDLVIIARARTESSKSKLLRAGADPPAETPIKAHTVLIALGTPDQLDGVRRLTHGG
jgi:voltage-gated potassium channel Kch